MNTKFYFLFFLISSSVWTLNAQKQVFQEPMPEDYTFYYLTDHINQANLEDAPYRFSGINSNVYLEFPVGNDNQFERFQIYKTQYMESGLAVKYPRLQSFVGKSKSGKTLYLAVTPYEIVGTVMRPGQITYLVKQYDNNRWIGFERDKQPVEEDFICETQAEPESSANNLSPRPSFNDRTLRKYRFAVSTTGEFSQYHLNRLGIPASETDANKKAAVVGELLIAVTRMNSVYERDFAISLMLVNNNDQIVFLDASTDPFDNNTTNMSSLLSANQTTVDNHIGSSNYDVAQVWCQGTLQGLAFLSVVCSTNKARGAVRGNQPETDRFIISVASHELGHQFGAYHVFYNSCGGNRTDNHAVETGSGTTIMAYAGICSPNIQYYTDDRFNTISINDFRNNLITTGSCSQNISLNNQPPTVNAGPDKWMPKETPFVLTATASDPEGDVLTYVWDEKDLPNHNYSTPPQSTWTTGPIFRPFPVRTENYRYFPNLDSLLANQTSTRWEVLPSVNRIMEFNVTVRDNNIEGGQTQNDRIALGIDDSAGPFRFTSQSSPETWLAGQQVNITWDVAGTDGGNINCTNLDLLLARDGRNFTDTLASNIANTGTYTLTVPNGMDTPNGRLMLKARDNYFLSISQANVIIGNYQETCGNTFSSTPGLAIPDNDTAGITDTIHINTNEFISDVNVTVDITHPYVSDLQVKLFAPDGTEVVLWNNNCGSQDNLNVTFDDEGNTIDCSNLTGQIQPIQPLSVLDSKYTQGDWVIQVIDNQAPDGGTLNSWSLNFCIVQQNVENNLIENVKVFPNPATDYLQIFIPDISNEKLKIQITDMNGRIILSKEQENPKKNLQIPLLDISSGSYILQLNQGNKFFNSVIIVK